MQFVDPKSYPNGWWDEPIFDEQNLIYIKEIEITVGDAESEKAFVACKLNPTDHRCFRLIVSIHNKDNPRRFFNLDPKLWYRTDAKTSICGALMSVVEKISGIFADEGLFPQSTLAGNNSHSVENTTFVLGKGPFNKPEPCMPHFHVWARGISGLEYFDVPFIGPNPGELMNMRGTEDSPKRKYDDHQKKELLKLLKNAIVKRMKE